MNYTIINNDSLLALEELEENSIDSIVTDPPYELNFMGKGWDNAGISFNKEIWQKCLRVLKPGGYLLAFGGSRTFHRIAVAIEDSGFEIRDTIMWLYGSGFPKSLNIGLALDKKNGVDNRTGNIKVDGSATGSIVTTGTGNLKKEYEERIPQNEWKGWGTALKPSFEPIIVARKPFKGSLVDNVIQNGVGGINIDDCRVESNGEKISVAKDFQDNNYSSQFGNENFRFKQVNTELKEQGRFPANTILTYDETDFEEVCGGFPNTNGGKRHNTAIRKSDKNSGYGFNINTRNEYEDSGSASRYFYCAKASKKDRDDGLDDFEEKICFSALNTKNGSGERLDGGKTPIRKNTHPTVKPTELMQYLVRLVTPKGGTILDPFMGSGSTGKAVMFENKERESNYKFIGIEKEKEYCNIAKARIEFAENKE